MKLRKIHIKNYKVFDDISLDFTDKNGKTLDTIVLAGVNGCGKTTLLEIIRDVFLNKFSKKDAVDIQVELDLSLWTDEELKDTMIHTRASRVSGISIVDAEKKYFTQNLTVSPMVDGMVVATK